LKEFAAKKGTKIVNREVLLLVNLTNIYVKLNAHDLKQILTSNVNVYHLPLHYLSLYLILFLELKLFVFHSIQESIPEIIFLHNSTFSILLHTIKK